MIIKDPELITGFCFILGILRGLRKKV